jgi:hypothetical protein
VGSCSQPISDERSRLEDFLNLTLWFRDLLNYSRRGQLIPLRSSFLLSTKYKILQMNISYQEETRKKSECLSNYRGELIFFLKTIEVNWNNYRDNCSKIIAYSS